MEASGSDSDAIPEYEELKLRVEAHDDGTYEVTAFAADGGTVTGTFTRPLSDQAVENFILKMPRARSVRTFQSSQMEKARELGGLLFETLMTGDVGDMYHGARRVADSKDRGLRITLSMTGAPDLLEIPWEFLYDPGDAYFLSQSIYTPVVRSLDLRSPDAPPTVTLPLQVLALVSAPGGYAELDTTRERDNLERALAPLVESGAVRLEWLETATLAELDRRIAARDELHVIHYIGHGAYDEEGTKNGILILEDGNGNPHKVTGEELGGLMRDERSLRLVVLNSCEGARTSHIDPFSGVASSLLRCGLPAVVGMQAEITDDAAVVFSDRLYSALAEGFPIDAALAQARRAIFAAGHDVEFGTPVLFMRVADGQIFKVSGSPPPPPVGSMAAVLRPDPPEVRAGESVTWRAHVKNDGESPLSDVNVTDTDGETRAGPFALVVGEERDVTWSVPVHSPIDETITVGGRGSDGRVVSTQAGAQVGVKSGGWPPWLRPAGIGAGAVVLLAVLLLATGILGGDDGGSGGDPTFEVFPAGGDVLDLDARGDKVAFVVPAGDAEEVMRLSLTGGDPQQVLPPAPHYNSIDLGLTAATHTRLVYSRCDEQEHCNIFMKAFNEDEETLPGTTTRCNEVRPTMSGGVTLFARSGEGCEEQLFLDPLGDAPPKPIAEKTGGSDLNDETAIWLEKGGLVAKDVGRNGTTLTDLGTLRPSGGDKIQAPVVVEDEFAYFVHRQGSQTFIARAKLPLGDSEIEHYVPGDEVVIAEESPHYGVTANKLYTTNYPQPNGDPATGMIVEIRNPRFE